MRAWTIATTSRHAPGRVALHARASVRGPADPKTIIAIMRGHDNAAARSRPLPEGVRVDTGATPPRRRPDAIRDRVVLAGERVKKIGLARGFRMRRFVPRQHAREYVEEPIERACVDSGDEACQQPRVFGRQAAAAE